MTDKWYPVIRSMPSKVIEADSMIFLHMPHTSFIKIRRHSLVIECLNVYIPLLIYTSACLHLEIYKM